VGSGRTEEELVADFLRASIMPGSTIMVAGSLSRLLNEESSEDELWNVCNQYKLQE
jgi:hypothetical protein